MSFETLIDRKNIPQKEKLYYLRQYLGGTAKTAVEGFFLLGTEAAYESAWQLLEKRFGDPFIIGKAFRNKLQDWPKINSKDGRELRDFADFLRSCEAAMPHIKTLEVLNDCNENQKILLKLPDWLVSSWNRKAMEARQAYLEHPPFKELFVSCQNKQTSLVIPSPQYKHSKVWQVTNQGIHEAILFKQRLCLPIQHGTTSYHAFSAKE